MIKRVWWAIKVGLFPHLERRKEKAKIMQDFRRKKQKMTQADSLLDTAIIDLTDALESKRK